MMQKIAVLGCGMVGSTIAKDLSKKFSVTGFDQNLMHLNALKESNPELEVRSADLKNTSAYSEWLQPFDLVVIAVPGFMGFETLKAVIEAGKDVVDISFFSEDALLLDSLAKEKNVTAVVDCGVAPGMSNLIAGYYDDQMQINEFACYVGGLPVERKKPFEYKAPFSPIDVIEEYIRPARIKENGQIVVKPALSEIELLDFEGIGTLEAFNTDGLRTLLFTLPAIPNLKEKTIRYPGHAKWMEGLKRAGFFSDRPIMVNGMKMRCIEATSAILFKEWKLEPGMQEFTIMKVNIEGEGKRIEYTLLDRFDPSTRTSSMSRTTGYTCSAAANLVLEGKFNEKGIFPPEFIGKRDGCFNYILDYLQERNVNWQKKEEQNI